MIEIITAEEAAKISADVRDARIVRDDKAFSIAMESIAQACKDGKSYVTLKCELAPTWSEAEYLLKKMGYSYSRGCYSIDISWKR